MSNPIFALLVIDCMIVNSGVGDKVTGNIEVCSRDVDGAGAVVGIRDFINSSVLQPKVVETIQTLQCEDGIDT